jgi:hypothetical protein
MKKYLTALMLVILIIAGWYFYPCFTFKGTYSTSWTGYPEVSTIDINDEFILHDVITVDYRLDFLSRTLWLNHKVEEYDEIPVLLRWNKVHIPVVHMEEGEYRKIKQGEPIN